MYITKIHLENVRCFKSLTINFEQPGQSILVAGDNGDGKSTLLRSIAMGLCDESSAAALLRELHGPFIRKGERQATIKVNLLDKGKVRYEIETTIKSLPAFERVTQKIWRSRGKRKSVVDQDLFPWQHIFISAYGAGPRTQGTADFQRYAAVDAVYTLFRYDEPLQTPELAIRRLVEMARKRGGNDLRRAQRYADAMLERLRDLLKRLLDLGPKDRVFLTERGIEIRGHWGRSELGALGDGYKATVTWLLDLIAWRMLSSKSVEAAAMAGIVLIDEVEQHLHPRWQIRIMSLLTEAFPKLQLIATTHSPLIISGCKGIPVHTLDRGQHFVYKAHGWLAEDVYRQVMGLPTTRAVPFRDLIDEYENLQLKTFKKEASSSDRAKLRAVQKELQKLPGTDPVTLMTTLKNISREFETARRRSRK